MPSLRIRLRGGGAMDVDVDMLYLLCIYDTYRIFYEFTVDI